jgi:hypothetical protein
MTARPRGAAFSAMSLSSSEPAGGLDGNREAEDFACFAAIAPQTGQAQRLCHKLEIRSSKSETNSKTEMSKRKRVTHAVRFGISNFEFVSDFGFRASSLWAKPVGGSFRTNECVDREWEKA